LSQFKTIKTVLVVDDSADMRSLVSYKLDSLGLLSHEAENGRIAIEKIKELKIDMIITDFRMPVLNGVQLLDWCRKNSVHVPVIFMSSDVHLVTPEQVALNDCCATMISKPFDDNVFTAAIIAADKRSHHDDCIHSRFS